MIRIADPLIYFIRHVGWGVLCVELIHCVDLDMGTWIFNSFFFFPLESVYIYFYSKIFGLFL